MESRSNSLLAGHELRANLEAGASELRNESAPRPAFVRGVGLGLRWDFLDEVLEGPKLPVAFFEVSPENTMRRGGYYPAALERIGERYRLVTHGLTLSLGGTREPEPEFLRELSTELGRVKTPWHSDHLSFSLLPRGMSHELLPVPFTRETARRVADRLRRLEDTLKLPMVVENITYYVKAGRDELTEAEFIRCILEDSGAGLLLDVNNIYVNAKNHGFDALGFLQELPLEKVVEIHIAGHQSSQWDILVDTHGAPVIPEVTDLLSWVLERIGPMPVLLERDNHVPPLETLLGEVALLQRVYDEAIARFESRRSVGTFDGRGF